MQKEKEKIQASADERLQNLREEKDNELRKKDEEIRELKQSIENLEKQEMTSEQKMNEQVCRHWLLVLMFRTLAPMLIMFSD